MMPFNPMMGQPPNKNKPGELIQNIKPLLKELITSVGCPSPISTPPKRASSPRGSSQTWKADAISWATCWSNLSAA